MMLINGFATLTSLKPDLDSLKKLLELGADIHKLIEDDRVKIGDGEEFKDEFVIQQLAECGDTLESLEVALKTRKDNQISMGDPKALKVMAKLGDIEKLMKAVKGCIADSSWTHGRDKRHAQEKAASMRKRILVLDPTIPAVTFWLRGTKDKLALQLMQRLHYASRAVMYWGLEMSFKFQNPEPLRSSTELKSQRILLDTTFESILDRYAGNVRSIWPPTESEQGLLYDPTSEQLASLKTSQRVERRTGKVYKVLITLQPKAMPFGGGRADVRLNEVRLWIVGAKVDPDSRGCQRVTAHILHMGNDVFEDESDDLFEFSHDMMSIPFEFDAVEVNKGKLTAGSKLSTSNVVQDQWTGNRSRDKTGISCVAAVGQFATWLLEVRESDNPGLDMQDVVSAHLEFSGANRSFTYSLKSI
ncbi:unnamed protein product [Penicillium glandicola]